jgi:hypothetical protein
MKKRRVVRLLRGSIVRDPDFGDNFTSEGIGDLEEVVGSG